MKQITISELTKILPIFDHCKKSVQLIGTYGIGKSMCTREYAETKAKNENRIFIDWNTISNEEKKECIANAEKYCVFVDFRLAQCDPSDLKGIPKLDNNQDYLITTPFSWAIYITQKDASGVLFFDETNLCTPLVSASCYQVINDRVISDRAIADKVFIIAAGNTVKDNPDVFEQPAPLKDRYIEYELTFNTDDWLTWAAGKVLPLVYSFCSWKKSMILQHNEGKDKDVTPRGIVRTSDCLKYMLDSKMITKLDEKLADIVISGSVGVGWSVQFRAFVKNYNELNWNKLLQNPESVNELNIDKKYAVIGGIIEKIFDLSTKMERDRKITQFVKDTTEAKTFYNYCKLLLSFDTELFVLGKLQIQNNKAANSLFSTNIMYNPIYNDLREIFITKHNVKLD